MPRVHVVFEVPKEPYVRLQSEVENNLRKRSRPHRRAITNGSVPFHLTLVYPFQEFDGCYELIHRAFASWSPQAFSLVGISSFEREAVYAKFTVSSECRLIIAHRALYKELGIKDPYPFYVPHVSVARRFEVERFRRIVNAFQEAWDTVFPDGQMNFVANKVIIYREVGRDWEEHDFFILEDPDTN